MLMIINLIELRMRKLIIGNNCPEFFSGLLDSYFFKITEGSDFLELCFCFQSLSNQSFKHNLAHQSSLSLTPSFLLGLGFICSSLTFTTQKASACSPWTLFNLKLTNCFMFGCKIYRLIYPDEHLNGS